MLQIPARIIRAAAEKRNTVRRACDNHAVMLPRADVRARTLFII
jgi:hypothetical protein